MSAFIASVFLFLIITVLLSLLGFRFWVQPKAALERVIGEVELAPACGPRARSGFP